MRQNLDELWQAVYEENAEFEPVKIANVKKRVNLAIDHSSNQGFKELRHINIALFPLSVFMILVVTIIVYNITIKNDERQENKKTNAHDNSFSVERISKEKRMAFSDGEKEGISVSTMDEPVTDEEESLYRIRTIVLNEGFYYAPANKGDGVFAVYAGTVIGAGWEMGYGYCVSISDAEGRTWKYGHCDEMLVNIGDNINMGDLIAHAGSTGVTTEDSIHIKLISEK